MATETLKDMKNELDEAVLEDIPADASDQLEKKRGKASGAAVIAKIKTIVKKPFSSKKAIMITVGGLILFIGLMAGGVLFLGKSSEKVKDAPHAVTQKEDAKAMTSLKKPVAFEDIIVLKPFDRIRLKEGSDMKLISMDLSLELTDTRYKKEVHAMEEKIRQIITDRMEEMTFLELRHPEGKIMLKYDLLKGINSIFSEVMIRNIYFTNFLMQ
ncbi:MAG: hypothetical protein A3J80_11160 [Desulfobacula sp. RIFOXYB2_FULL_45_6]|nr:MAG: hypothetical protein A3J80_11160 [Desulfobacula sp. RIFOXYB2_FULL_45_6]